VQLANGVQAARQHQVDPQPLHRADDLAHSVQDPVAEQAVGGDRHGAQRREVNRLGPANPAQQFGEVFAQERFAAGNVQLPQAVEFRGGEQPGPGCQGQIGDGLGDAPDVAHAAAADAAVGDFETDRLQRGGFAGPAQVAVAQAVDQQFQSDATLVHDSSLETPCQPEQAGLRPAGRGSRPAGRNDVAVAILAALRRLPTRS
jgi:hypothetical protein